MNDALALEAAKEIKKFYDVTMELLVLKERGDIDKGSEDRMYIEAYDSPEEFVTFLLNLVENLDNLVIREFGVSPLSAFVNAALRVIAENE